MNPRERNDDLAFLLYLVPFIISAVYALYLWAGTGLSAVLPQFVFLQVTQSPYVFLVGLLAVVVGSAIDALGADDTSRRERLVSLSQRLQWIAVIALIFALLSAWYAAGFDPGGAIFNLLSGRYSVIFPGLLMLYSFLILPSLQLERSKMSGLLAVVFMLAAPLVLYEVGKRSYPVGMGGALVLIVLGVVLFIRGQRKPQT
jgi:hypothetical protein